MTSVGTQRIPFNICLSGMAYRGEITGNSLDHDSEFMVQLSDGQQFSIKVYGSIELLKYSWRALINTQFDKLTPIIGRVIERHFHRKKV